MSKLTKRILLIVSILFGVILIQTYSQASGLELKRLEYNVYLNEDGSANVTEKWRISIQDTNTLFKTFEMDQEKYTGITDVSVKEIKSDGSKINFRKINQEKYHVDKNFYYALKNKKGQFEIAWGAHAEDVIKTYEINYKIIDAVKNYADCSEFYWQFISTNSEIPATIVEGTITLPKAVANKEELKVWAHGPLNGNINIVSNQVIKFQVLDLQKNTMLEARILTPTNLFLTNANTSNKAKLQSILTQEQQWAEEANRQREEMIRMQEQRKMIMRTIFIVSNIIGLILAVIIIRKIIQYHKILKENPVLKPETEYPYFRDYPDETATPAQAGFVYYFKNGGLQYHMSKIISASMLDLCLKGYITFEPVAAKKDQINVILKQKETLDLQKDEKIIYELFEKVANKETRTFTMKELEKYAKNHSGSVLSKTNEVETVVKEIQEEKGNYEKELIEMSGKWKLKEFGFTFLAIFSLIFMQILFIPALIALNYTFIIARRYNRLTQKGINEKEAWMGLKRYMSDFSLMKEKEVPELVLWEKYLVYATVFGISEKVLKQLKVVYPQIADEQYLTSHGYAYMYLMYSGNFHNSFLNTLNISTGNTYTTLTNYSSGSGVGGGFSIGGGFGGGGGRNGR